MSLVFLTMMLSVGLPSGHSSAFAAGQFHGTGSQDAGKGRLCRVVLKGVSGQGYASLRNSRHGPDGRATAIAPALGEAESGNRQAQTAVPRVRRDFLLERRQAEAQELAQELTALERRLGEADEVSERGWP